MTKNNKPCSICKETTETTKVYADMKNYCSKECFQNRKHSGINAKELLEAVDSGAVSFGEQDDFATDSRASCEPPCGPDRCTRRNGNITCRLDFVGGPQ